MCYNGFMTKAVFILWLAATLVAPVFGETLRLKYQTTVDVLDDAGKVVGQRKLKAGSAIALADPVAPVAQSNRLAPLDIAPILFKTNRPASAVLRAELRLADSYYGHFETQRGKVWSADVYVYDADWENFELFTGYFGRNTQLGKRLAALLQDGKNHRCTVKVSFAKDEIFDDLLMIHDFEPLP